MSATIEPVSFSYETAAAGTGISEVMIRRAVKAGDIEVRYPKVNGRPIAKPVIERDELARWIKDGATAR